MTNMSDSSKPTNNGTATTTTTTNTNNNLIGFPVTLVCCPCTLFTNISDRLFGTATTTTTNTNNNPTAPANESNLYSPTARPQPHNCSHRSRSGRSICCRCCCWTILIFVLLVAVSGAALYFLYRPRRPAFSIPSLLIHHLSLTTSADSSSSHLSTLLNLTIISKNPDSHFSFFYDPFTISSFSSHVFLGKGTLPAFSLSKKKETSFRDVVVSGSNDLDAESVNALISDLNKEKSNGGVTLKIQLDTKTKVQRGGLTTKKVGIRVTCDGITVAVPKGESPTVAVSTGSKCEVDLRIKIWKWTL